MVHPKAELINITRMYLTETLWKGYAENLAPPHV